MRTVFPLELSNVFINGSMVSLGLGHTYKPFVADEAALLAILEAGVKCIVLDADGGELTADTVLGWSSPNVFEANGSFDITIPVIPSGNAQAFNGMTLQVKNMGTGTLNFVGTIDGDSGGYSSSMQFDCVELQVINGKWARV